MAEAEQKKINVLLFGLGAIGGFYAFILGQDENISLTVCARSNYETVKNNGLLIHSENHGTHKVNIDSVIKSPSESPRQAFDYILLTNKALNLSTLPPLFQSVTNPKTVFILLQNGIGNEDAFRSFYPTNTILSCVVWVGASQSTPGTINHIKAEHTEIGLFANPSPQIDEQAALTQFANFLSNAASSCEIVQDIQRKRWEKVIWNAAWNPLTTLTGMQVQPYLRSSPQAMASTKQLMREMISVAKRSGVPGLEYGLVDVLIERVLALQPIYSSMYVDAKEGRPLEVEVILGVPMRKAIELGMEDDVPVLRFLYSLMTGIDQRITGGKQA